ncbi:glycoside hydrolase N-terminal domain-containing protein [Actinomycetes bacterium KLBMP 9797]
MAPLRAAVVAGDHRRADELARALQSDRWVQAFQPLGWIEWEHDRAQSGKTSAAYRRSLDMSAVVAVTDAGTGVRLETFVSAVDYVLVARADRRAASVQPAPRAHDVAHTVRGHVGDHVGRAPANVLPHYVPDDTPVIYADDAPDEDGLVDDGMGFALVVAWVADERGGRLAAAAAESGCPETGRCASGAGCRCRPVRR